ncbi:MAG: carboxypeptidase-like regulatory domain-containing protein, partial [Terracidiphilus sp.]
MMKRIPVILLMLMILALSGMGQSTKGAVSGKVADASGAVIQKASFKLEPSGLTTTSDALGEFLFPIVTPG